MFDLYLLIAYTVLFAPQKQKITASNRNVAFQDSQKTELYMLSFTQIHANDKVSPLKERRPIGWGNEKYHCFANLC
jgi:hypothetical protein